MQPAQFCRHCGAVLRNPNARFCSVCGRPLAGEAATVPDHAVETCLVVQAAGESARQVPLSGTTVTLGRASDNDIVLPQPYVSLQHGRLELRDESWHYSDLGSTNGTYYNGRRVTETQLRTGDVLRIGDPHGNSVGLTLHCPGAIGATAGSGTIALGTGALDPLASITLGRNPRSTLHLDGAVVSWNHARIDPAPTGRVLVDLNSTNGTFINGTRVVGSAPLSEGDVIRIGPFKLVYQTHGLEQYSETGGVRLDGIDVARVVRSGKGTRRILDGVSLSVYPREFVALVGTSGAGKSTLMKALSGVERAQEGQVLVNGEDLYQQFDLYRTMIGYVPQDDILHRELKVGDALRYSAQLRLPPDTTAEEIERRIDRVLEDVEMVAQKDQPISSLSGGQRKRVSIAAELLAEPRIFFLDEPTSGLDPGLEKKMMYTLRKLADAGRTVVLVTHATANIAQCDHVCFLSQGRLTYYGPPSDTFSYFGLKSADFADVYDQLDDIDPQVAREQAEQWRQRYRSSPLYQRYVAQRQQMLAAPAAGQPESDGHRGPRVNPLRQLAVLTRRYFNLVFADRLLLTVLLAIMPLVALLVLLVAGNTWLVGDTPAEIERQLAAEFATGATSATYSVVADSQRLLFIMAFASVLLGLFASGYEVVKEWSVYRRERMVTLRIVPYLLSKVIVVGMFAMVQCLLLLVVIGLKVEYPAEGVLLPVPVEMYITLFLGTIAAVMLGLLISSIVPNANTVTYLVFVVLMGQIIFSGVLFKLSGISEQASALSFTRWSMEALGSSADVESLNRLTITRFQPEPVTEVVSLEVEKPADDWEPVTVITRTQEISVPVQPGIAQTVPISVPEVIENELVMVTEVVTESVTITPDPVDIVKEASLYLSYAREPRHLIQSWLILAGFSLALGVVTIFVLRSKDVA